MDSSSNLISAYKGQVVQLAPETCSPQEVGVIVDAQKQVAASCETISFSISNTGDAKYLIFGPRGLAGNDSLYSGDAFQGSNFADASTFLVNGVANGAPFQGFNFRCGQTSYLLRSVTFRTVPQNSPVVNTAGKTESYGCDPDNVAPAKKVRQLCAPCGNSNSDYTDVRYDLKDFPIDYMHAFGVLIPAGTVLTPTNLTIDVDISSIATARVYVPCGV